MQTKWIHLSTKAGAWIESIALRIYPVVLRELLFQAFKLTQEQLQKLIYNMMRQNFFQSARPLTFPQFQRRQNFQAATTRHQARHSIVMDSAQPPSFHDW